MPCSGVKVPDQCVADFKEMQQKHKQRCIIYAIKDDEEFCIYKQIGRGCGDQKEEFDAIVAEVKSDPSLLGLVDSDKANPCVMVWDLNVPSEGKANKDVLLFMTVCPDKGITMKKKMVFSSSIKDLREKLTGIMKSTNISSIEELNYQNALEAMK